MDAVLRRGEAAPLPRPSRESAGSTFGAGSAITALRRRISARLAELPPVKPRELPPEWFRYPLP